MSFPFKIPFASSGDQSTVPDTDLTGSVNFTDGYTPDYQADPSLDPNAKLIERDKFNFLMNKTTSAIGEIQRQGSADWYSELAPYDLNAEVFYNGKRWRSTIANNSATPDTGSEWLDVTPGTAAAKDVAAEATASTVPVRDANGTFKVGAPTNPEHPFRMQEFDAKVDFTIIYPNGGSESSPANVSANARYVEANPFPGHRVLCCAELLINGEWGDVGFIYSSQSGSAGGYGTAARQLGSGDIIVQTGSWAISSAASSHGGAPQGYTSAPPVTVPCRVKVWKVKGATV